MNRAWYRVVAAAAFGLIVVGAWLWWHSSSTSARPTPTPTVAALPTPAASAASAASAPIVRHPLGVPVAAQTPAGPLDVDAALTELFGRKVVLSMFQLQDFPRRLVATVDNLGRLQAQARLWPVNPAGGTFIVEKNDDAAVISAGNGLRYTPYVLLMETVDLR